MIVICECRRLGGQSLPRVQTTTYPTPTAYIVQTLWYSYRYCRVCIGLIVILWYYPAAVLMVFSHTFTHELLCAHTLHKFTGVSVADSIVN